MKLKLNKENIQALLNQGLDFDEMIQFIEVPPLRSIKGFVNQNHPELLDYKPVENNFDRKISKKERDEIKRLSKERKSHYEISLQLGISIKRVSTYIKGLSRKRFVYKFEHVKQNKERMEKEREEKLKNIEEKYKDTGISWKTSSSECSYVMKQDFGLFVRLRETFILNLLESSGEISTKSIQFALEHSPKILAKINELNNPKNI